MLPNVDDADLQDRKVGAFGQSLRMAWVIIGALLAIHYSCQGISGLGRSDLVSIPLLSKVSKNIRWCIQAENASVLIERESLNV